MREFKYLGTIISADGTSGPDIKRRLELADHALRRMKKIIWNRQIRRWIRMRVLMSFIYPVATYGCETWTLRQAERDTLRVWWMKILRRIYGTWLTEKVRSAHILEALKTSHITDMVDLRRRRYVGHISRYPKERIVKQTLGATWPSQGNKKRKGKTVTWMSMVKQDLRYNDLDVHDTKVEWRNKILDLYWKDKQKGTNTVVEGT